MGSTEEMAYLFVIALTVLLSWALTGLATWYASRVELLDHPGDRHSHQHPTPRGGGAGLVVALISVTALLMPASIPDMVAILRRARSGYPGHDGLVG